MGGRCRGSGRIRHMEGHRIVVEEGCVVGGFVDCYWKRSVSLVERVMMLLACFVLGSPRVHRRAVRSGQLLTFPV